MEWAKNLKRFLRFMPVLICAVLAADSWSEETSPAATPSPSGSPKEHSAQVITPPSAPPPQPEGFMQFKKSSKADSDTYQYLNKRNDPNPSMNKEAADYESGK